MTTRLRDWQSRLQACLAERWSLPFAWGSQDCALFGADCVEACTGVDPAADLRGTYDSALSAERVLRKHGGLAGIASARLGEEIPPALAQPGDIGLLLNDGRECLAVCGGSRWIAPGVDGLGTVLVQQVQRAWRVTKGGA